MTAWDQDDDSCNRLGCLLLACKRLQFHMAVGAAVVFQVSQLPCRWGCRKLLLMACDLR